MDSLKIPKGGSSTTGGSAGTGGGATKQTGTVPITVRFNASEECIDDIFQSFHNNSNSGSGGGGGSSANSGGGDSLSSSPSQHHHHQQQQQQQQNVDEVNTRNNFLQSNFFNRKRSGSIEGISPTSSGPNLIAALSGGDATSVGTWKLIKGKVSQTIEDIKSSKSSSQVLPTVISKAPIEALLLAQIASGESQQQQHEPDSDQENATGGNTSISEELPLDQEHKHNSAKGDSDSDIDNEILLEGDVERSRLRRGLANLKSKVKSRSQQQQQQQQSTLSSAISHAAVKAMNKDTSPSRASASTTLRGNFLRKRKKDAVETGEPATPSNESLGEDIPIASGKREKTKGIVAGKKLVEIESGVEMLEDMIPPTPNADNKTMAEDIARQKRDGMELPLKHFSSLDSMDSGASTALLLDVGSAASESDMKISLDKTATSSADTLRLAESESLQFLYTLVRRLPILTILGLVLVFLLPIYDFLRGVFSCMLLIALIEWLTTLVQGLVESLLVTNPPEKSKFQVPDYKIMPICEIPSVEEHKTIKTYSGWMNEINSYDPNNFHISMSKSVYVKLEGTVLRIATTTARIPKRIMWNEKPFDRKALFFTEQRTFNLLGARIELLPAGLAKKRFFNRKYPIQLIVKNGAVPAAGEQTTNSSKRPSTCSTNKDSDSQYLSVSENRTNNDALSQKSHGMEQTDEPLERTLPNVESEMDFGTTILSADLQVLHSIVNAQADAKEIEVPCGDEVRLLLFSRGDREKEDWYRRFVAASVGDVHDQNLSLPNMKLVDDSDMQAAAVKAALKLTHSKLPNPKQSDTNTPVANSQQATTSSGATNEHTPTGATIKESDESISEKQSAAAAKKELTFDYDMCDEKTDLDCTQADTLFAGLLMGTSVARNPTDYIRFMALYQNACNESQIPVFKQTNTQIDITQNKRRKRRAKRQEDELWKGIDQSLFLGPSGSVVWLNVLAGRMIYSVLNDNVMQEKIKKFLQKKLYSIRLPSFMEDVVITQIDLGTVPPLIHRVSQPMLDERGMWIDADVTYEGLLQITVTTKLNLLRLKRPMRSTTTTMTFDTPTTSSAAAQSMHLLPDDANAAHFADVLPEGISSNAIFDSDAESSGGSSTESESPTTAASTTEQPNAAEFNVFNTTPGNARRIFKIVDRFAASNFFQYATELSYVQRAMENMSANITLRVEMRGLVGRGTINIPPPPSDRVWLAFRGPPRLWISAKPAVGDKSVDWSIVTNVIESKLCEEVNKFLVYPNMVDIQIPLLGQSTYKE